MERKQFSICKWTILYLHRIALFQIIHWCVDCFVEVRKKMVGQKWRGDYSHLFWLGSFLSLTHLYGGGWVHQDIRAGSTTRKPVLQGLPSFLCLSSNIPMVCDFSGGHFDRERERANQPQMWLYVNENQIAPLSLIQPRTLMTLWHRLF